MFLCTSKKCSYWNILNHTLFSIRHHWSSGFPLLLGLDTDLSLRPSRSPVTCQLSRGWVRAPLSLVSMFQACSLAVHPARHCFFLMQDFPCHVPTRHVLSWDLDSLNPPTFQHQSLWDCFGTSRVLLFFDLERNPGSSFENPCRTGTQLPADRYLHIPGSPEASSGRS